ncbi:hypothetical protein C8R48DRAFT_678517 [Suillus tomentosus]|nr:hypothetical protein C8R48DRAFT_678517 [Suillus tomentosus]
MSMEGGRTVGPRLGLDIGVQFVIWAAFCFIIAFVFACAFSLLQVVSDQELLHSSSHHLPTTAESESKVLPLFSTDHASLEQWNDYHGDLLYWDSVMLRRLPAILGCPGPWGQSSLRWPILLGDLTADQRKEYDNEAAELVADNASTKGVCEGLLR